MSKKKEQDVFLEELKHIYKDVFDYSKVKYINNTTKILLTCKKHKKTFEALPSNLLKGVNSCPECICEKRKKSRYEFTSHLNKLTKIAKKNNLLICVRGDERSKDKVTYKCLICGEIHSSKLDSIERGHGCPKCARERVKIKKRTDPTIAFNNLLKISKENNYTIKPFIYNNQHQKIKCKCNICGHEWEQTYNHLIRGRKCSRCSWKRNTDKFRYTTDNVLKQLKTYAERNHYKVKSVESYINNSTSNILCECIKCGKEFYISLSNAKHNNACPNHNNSKGENYIETILLKYKIPFKKQVHKKEFNWLGRQSLDFYLPEHKIAIEFQGAQHFVSDTTFPYFDLNKQIEKDKQKYELCKKHDIEILYFTFIENQPPLTYFGKLYTDIDELLKNII